MSEPFGSNGAGNGAGNGARNNGKALVPTPGRGGDRDIRRVQVLVDWLDRKLLDPIIGLLLPGVGDLLTSIAGGYVLVVAVRKGVPAIVIARMLLNLAIDAALGAIPLVGDVFDFVYRANRRNAQLLAERHSDGRSSPTDWLIVLLAAALFVAALALPIMGAVQLFDALF